MMPLKPMHRQKRRQEARQRLLSLHHRKIKRQPLSSFTGSGRYAEMALRAVRLEEELVHVMAVYGVGNTPMARATNARELLGNHR